MSRFAESVVEEAVLTCLELLPPTRHSADALPDVQPK